MIESNVGMNEMALVAGLLAQMAKDFSEGTDESKGAKKDREKMIASFLETSRFIVALLGGHLGSLDAAIGLIQQVMLAYAEQNEEDCEDDEG